MIFLLNFERTKECIGFTQDRPKQQFMVEGGERPVNLPTQKFFISYRSKTITSIKYYICLYIKYIHIILYSIV